MTIHRIQFTPGAGSRYRAPTPVPAKQPDPQIRDDTVLKIVSGGQTGVDRAALDVAIELNLPHGGWCPQGRRAEDGVIATKYQLQETKSRQYAVRTRWNVRDSDATLIIAREPLQGGTALTAEIAQSLDRPCLVVAPSTSGNVTRVRKWIDTHSIRVLNVAGPRESSEPGIYARALGFLRRLLGNLKSQRSTGARRLADVTADTLDRLQRGEQETRTLAEGLAIDFRTLLQHVAPELSLSADEEATLAKPHGITRRMESAGPAAAASLWRRTAGDRAVCLSPVRHGSRLGCLHGRRSAERQSGKAAAADPSARR